MKCAKLVAIWISYIGQVHRPQLALTQTRSILNRHAAVRHCRIMELANLLRRAALEAYGSTVGKRCSHTVDRLAHAKRSSIVPVEETSVTCLRRILKRLSYSKYPEH